MRVFMEIEIPEENMDSMLFSWLEELADKGREQGSVEVFKLVGLKPSMDMKQFCS